MRFKICAAVLIGVFGNTNAYADSFCGFDNGLIGTKAIGYVAPFSLKTEIYEAGICELKVHKSPTIDSISDILSCTTFQHIPSQYIDHTVYFPYREPSGTITMVMTHGPNCD